MVIFSKHVENLIIFKVNVAMNIMMVRLLLPINDLFRLTIVKNPVAQINLVAGEEINSFLIIMNLKLEIIDK